MVKLKAFVMPIALALALSITAAFDASAQSLQKACDIQELRTGYQSLSDKVEGVSPDMSSYIKREGKKALKEKVPLQLSWVAPDNLGNETLPSTMDR
jgi:hypothetical protein